MYTHMRYQEERFEEYVRAVENNDLHPNIGNIFEEYSSEGKCINNIIFYGPSGVGKYSQALRVIKSYSPTDLKYSNVITLDNGKYEYRLKISDIHYEIDMELLGCNARTLWSDIHSHILDVIRSKHSETKMGIILCKNFHAIDTDLLDSFYSYMQNIDIGVKVIYIFLTEAISFIPDCIVDVCETVSVNRPSKAAYNRCFNINTKNVVTDTIHNIKELKNGIQYINPSYKYSECLVNRLIDYKSINISNMREMLYNMLIYDLCINECIWCIIKILIKTDSINRAQLGKILVNCYSFFHHYKNNYRPIYHLESFIYSLIQIIHEL